MRLGNIHFYIYFLMYIVSNLRTIKCELEIRYSSSVNYTNRYFPPLNPQFSISQRISKQPQS